MSDSEIITATLAGLAIVITAVFTGYREYRNAKWRAEIEREKADRQVVSEGKDAEVTRIEANQKWIDDRQREMFTELKSQLATVTRETTRLQKEHMKCREESVVLAARLEDAENRITELEARLAPVNGKDS